MNNKPLLVFIPGTLCTSHMFLPAVDNLKYDSLLIDFDCHDSLQAMSEEILRQLGDIPFIPVGFSMGGMVAFELIRRVGEQIQGVILLNSNAHADLPGRQEGRERHLEVAKKTSLTNLMQDVYLPIYFEDSQSAESAEVLQMAETLGVDVFEAQLKVLAQRPDSLDDLRAFNKPTLIVGGENDLPCPAEHQLLMADTAVKSELHIVPKCGHFTVLEKPQEVAELIIRWLEKNYE
jgi:pimeloyl-ACP methyl ester carboxylesterase